MESDRSSRGIYGLASANSALDGIPFRIGTTFKVPNKVSIPKELLRRRNRSALADEYFFHTEEGVILWAKAQQQMKKNREATLKEYHAQKKNAQSRLKNPVPMPLASEGVYVNIHMADKILTPTPIKPSVNAFHTDNPTSSTKSQIDVTQFEQEDDPFENVERQVINEFEELNQVFQNSAESLESPEGNYENVVINKPPLPLPDSIVAGTDSASPNPVPALQPITAEEPLANDEGSTVEITRNKSETDFQDGENTERNIVYGNLPYRKKSTSSSQKKRESNNYVMVSYANGRLVHDATKLTTKQLSLDEESKPNFVSNYFNQKFSASQENTGSILDPNQLNESIYENLPISSTDNYENCLLPQRSRHSVAFDVDTTVNPPAIPPRTDLTKLRSTHSTPNIHQASSDRDAETVSPFHSPSKPAPRKQIKSPASPVPRKQSWSRHSPLPPIRARSNGQVSQGSVDTSCSDDSPTDYTQATDPFSALSQEAQTFAQQYLSMGFPRARVARAVQKLGLQEKDVIDHLCMVDKLGEGGYDPHLVEDALHLFENDIQKAECYLHLHQQFVELGFQKPKIQHALVTSKLDSDKALDLLTT
ncbi:Hypothetical predicted protein [Octopus vulgaris]|uniref:Uncharacterized protein n=2 Tax=Octopus TaxID=6643 RepID=A0AA36FB37_OCTVU|nr:ubiquitin-associated protein 1 [Octopus sinensis]XP_029643566.1 ubiquitin-associated protein 1 [Octopus sinensis]XP_036363719.1 ubiquitin-associated protein 1 [Octopus sinensis]XP_036363720.1 ubiquitin-associated protein 1 [Octopus sinensis]XP_036363721.1 ubiquitin-associated protein 1 [Octopus sinensis]CAI9731047.1 Hypothetical predicted protein [Octopus vulgaris]